jgi:hypothetical protein
LTSTTKVVVAALHELVEALDRRVRHVETRIACDVAAFRDAAVNRVHELSGARCAREIEAERSGGVMTDDGGPLTSGD